MTDDESTVEAIRDLCRKHGPVEATRIVRPLLNWPHDYTLERDAFLGDATVDELAAEILRQRASGTL